MKLFKSLIASILIVASTSTVNAQCNTNTSICTSGISGPYTFTNPGTPVSSCLDFFGPSYAYIILHITQSGPLEMLIEGDASSGFLDVAIFNVPAGVTPCSAIENPSNEISCNYASAASGCNQIGSFFSCPSSVAAPMVSAGDVLMIVVENWSGVSSNFTLQLGPAPAAQTGPADPTITLLGGNTFNDSNPPVQLGSATLGGTWSGTGVSSTGVFDPALAGPGTHVISYSTGSGPCFAQDTIHMNVTSSLAVEMNDIKVSCEEEGTMIAWETVTETNCDYFKIERSRDGENFEAIGEVDGHGTTTSAQQYTFVDEAQTAYYRIVEVDYDGTNTVYGPFMSSCSQGELFVAPNPASDQIQVKYSGFNALETNISCVDKMGHSVFTLSGNMNGEVTIPVQNLAQGVYSIIISDAYQTETTRFIKL